MTTDFVNVRISPESVEINVIYTVLFIYDSDVAQCMCDIKYKT